MVFIRDGVLMAQAFDVGRLELTGQAAPLVDQFAFSLARTGPFAVGSGALAFRRVIRADSSLTWFDRTGRQLGVVGNVGIHVNPELSKDDRYVAWDEGPRPGSDTWIADIERGVTTPFTSDPVIDGLPQWSPDGRSIIRRVDREGAAGSLYQRPVGVVGEDTLLLKPANPALPTDWSMDGRYVLYVSASDIWALTLPDRKPLRVTNTPFDETNARLSPDGRWVAFESNEGGKRATERDLCPVVSAEWRQGADIDQGRIGTRWRRDGREL